MIKFFRKIRQKLLTENQPTGRSQAGEFSKPAGRRHPRAAEASAEDARLWPPATSRTGRPASRAGKYLIYAIGEIILVIIGILIALSINNWNEKQKLKDIQQNLLKDLQVEVTNNIKDLEKVIASHENSLVAAQKMDSLFNDREAFN